MAIKQIVTLKGRKDGINIILDADAPFEEIQASLRDKAAQGKKFFGGADVKIFFKGRELDEFSEKVLIDIITEETNLGITLKNEEKPVLPPPAPSRSPAPPSPLSPPLPQSAKNGRRESPTVFHRGGLRSGQSIRYKGSVVVMGDANPGSEIIADGNVIVLGALKGLAHAGAAGDETCFVSALLLQPTQLRIAGYISYVPDGASARSAAAYAYIKEGQVFIGPL